MKVIIRNVSLAQEDKRWFISIQVQQESTAVATGAVNLEPPTLGIDMGLAAFVATSTGRLVDPLQALKRKQCRLRRYQRSVSRKVKGSQNRKKAVAKLAALHRKIACERADWLRWSYECGCLSRNPGPLGRVDVNQMPG